MEKRMSEETVEVTLNLPKGLMDFLNDYKVATGFDTIKAYLEDAVVDRVRADIDAGTFSPTVKAIAEEYNLKEAFDVS